jgi:hypothetical protein
MHTSLVNKVKLELAKLLDLALLSVILVKYKWTQFLEPYAVSASPVDPPTIF